MDVLFPKTRSRIRCFCADSVLAAQLRQILGTFDAASGGQRFLGELLSESANSIPTVIPNWYRILPRYSHRAMCSHQSASLTGSYPSMALQAASAPRAADCSGIHTTLIRLASFGRVVRHSTLIANLDLR